MWFDLATAAVILVVAAVVVVAIEFDIPDQSGGDKPPEHPHE